MSDSGQGAAGTGPSDEALMIAYQGGDGQAFEALFARYAPVLLGLFLRQIRSRTQAEDLVQETFLHLHRARRDFRADARLRPWLMTIALNLKREHFRRQGRRREQGLDGRAEQAPDPASGAAEQRVIDQGVREAVAALPEKQREAIELHWFADLPFSEVAQVLGATESAVKVWAHRGYQALRTALGETAVTEGA